MGMLDKLREKSQEKFNRELEQEFEDDKQGKFEELKDFMLSMYESGMGIDDEDGYKGDINKCFQSIISPIHIPSSYVSEFKQYVLNDPDVKKIIGSSNNSDNKASDEDDETTKELKEKLEKERKDHDGDITYWYTNLINKKERAIIKPFLNDNENKEITKYYNKKQEVLEKKEELDSDDFINFAKNWLTKYKNTYKFTWDILVEINVDDKLITDDELDELGEFYDNIPEETINKKDETKQNNSSSSCNDISDIKAKLEKLKSLKEDGLISEEDFEKKKADLLALI